MSYHGRCVRCDCNTIGTKVVGDRIVCYPCQIQEHQADLARLRAELGAARARVGELERDRARLDFLEQEMAFEEDGMCPRGHLSVFRRNLPITREAIDEAEAALSPPEGGGAS